MTGAERLGRNRLCHGRLGPLPDGERPETIEEGYALQQAAHQLLAPSLGRRTGYKIGCTTPVMQAYLGIPSPCAAGLFERSTHPSGIRLDPADFVHPGVECEIAVRLARSLAPGALPLEAGDVAAAIEAYLPAIEIVDDRYVDWRTIGTPTLIADDFFSAGCVLGPDVHPSAVTDLRDLAGEIRVNGRCVGTGQGRDVMGHPHAALAWLANHLASRGAGLEAGDIVLTGSLVQTVWLDPGDSALIRIAALGDVALTLEASRAADAVRDR